MVTPRNTIAKDSSDKCADSVGHLASQQEVQAAVVIVISPGDCAVAQRRNAGNLARREATLPVIMPIGVSAGDEQVQVAVVVEIRPRGGPAYGQAGLDGGEGLAGLSKQIPLDRFPTAPQYRGRPVISHIQDNNGPGRW